MQEGSIPFEECQASSFMCCPTCHTLGHTGTTGSLPYMSAEFFKKLIARGQYLKNCYKFIKNPLASPMRGNWGIKCFKHKASLWLLHPTQGKRGTLRSKQCFKPPFSPEFMLVVSMQGNLESHNEIFCLMKNCSRANEQSCVTWWNILFDEKLFEGFYDI